MSWASRTCYNSVVSQSHSESSTQGARSITHTCTAGDRQGRRDVQNTKIRNPQILSRGAAASEIPKSGIPGFYPRAETTLRFWIDLPLHAALLSTPLEDPAGLSGLPDGRRLGRLGWLDQTATAEGTSETCSGGMNWRNTHMTHKNIAFRTNTVVLGLNPWF